jgi:hypothetical protein
MSLFLNLTINRIATGEKCLYCGSDVEKADQRDEKGIDMMAATCAASRS